MVHGLRVLHDEEISGLAKGKADEDRLVGDKHISGQAEAVGRDRVRRRTLSDLPQQRSDIPGSGTRASARRTDKRLTYEIFMSLSLR